MGLLLDAMVSARLSDDPTARALGEVLEVLVQAYLYTEYHAAITDTRKGALAWARRQKGKIWGVAESNPNRAMVAVQLMVKALSVPPSAFPTYAAAYLMGPFHVFDVARPNIDVLVAQIRVRTQGLVAPADVAGPLDPRRDTKRLAAAASFAKAALRALGVGEVRSRNTVDNAQESRHAEKLLRAVCKASTVSTSTT